MGAWEHGEGRLPEESRGKENGSKRAGRLTLGNTEPPWLDHWKRWSTLQKHIQCRDSWERHLTVVADMLYALRGKHARADGSLKRAGSPKKEVN